MASPGSIGSEAFAAVLAAAQQNNLGVLRGSYEPKWLKPAALIGILLMGLVFLVILAGIVFLVLAFRTPNLNKKRAAMRLHLFEYGLIIADSTGPTAIFRWDRLTVTQEITRRYVNGIYVGTTYVYTLTTPEGNKTKITNFYDKPDEWGPAIQIAITGAQLPAAIAALEAGAELHFGPLTVNRGGVATSTKSIRWDEIQDIDVNAGYLRIKKAASWIRWSAKPVSAIPNFFVFLSVANHLRQAYPTAPAQPGPSAV